MDRGRCVRTRSRGITSTDAHLVHSSHTCRSIPRMSACRTLPSFASTRNRARVVSHTSFSALCSSTSPSVCSLPSTKSYKVRYDTHCDRILRHALTVSSHAAISDRTSKEITEGDIVKAFRTAYYIDEHTSAGRFQLVDYSFSGSEGGKKSFEGVIADAGSNKTVKGSGNGPVSSLLDALKSLGLDLDVKEYSEHAIGTGSDTKAASYVELVDAKSKRSVWGVGIDEDVTAASLRAVLSAASNASISNEERIKEIEDKVVGNRYGGI